MPKSPRKQALRKEVLRAGRIYWSPKGPIPIPAELAQSFVTQFQRMSDDGLAVPVCVGHQDFAKPCMIDDEILSNPKVVGTLDDLSLLPDGTLSFAWTPKDGVIGQRRLPNLASPEFTKVGLRSANGAKYGPSVLHMALTDRPVNAGQPGEWQIVPSKRGVYRMSLEGTWSKQPITQLADDDESPPPAEESDLTPSDSSATSSDEEDVMKGVGEETENTAFNTVLAGLAECYGLTLPTDTTAENFFERAATALVAVKGHDAMQEKESAESEEGYTEEPNYAGGPMVNAMSLEKQVQTLSGQIQRMSAEWADERRSRITDRMDRIPARLQELVGRGQATPDEIEKRWAKIRTVRMSIDKQPERVRSGIEQLEAWIADRETLPRGAVCPETSVDRMASSGGSGGSGDDLEEMALSPIFTSGDGDDTYGGKSAKEIARGPTKFGGR